MIHFPVELSLIVAETSEKSTGDESDVERISPTIQRTEVRIVSNPPRWYTFSLLYTSIGAVKVEIGETFHELSIQYIIQGSIVYILSNSGV